MTTRPAFSSLSTDEVQARVVAALGGSLEPWARQCHAASLALVKAQPFADFLRVARGSCREVPGQHSWVVVGRDCYAPAARVIDPTRWSYDGAEAPYVWTGVAAGRPRSPRYRPAGAGSIWSYGRPAPKAPDAEAIVLDGEAALSEDAKEFLALLGPLCRKGWSTLANSPVEGWPASEIFTAMARTPKLAALVPIDVLGMVTNVNPGGLFLGTSVESPDSFFRSAEKLCRETLAATRGLSPNAGKDLQFILENALCAALEAPRLDLAAEVRAEARRLRLSLNTSSARDPITVRELERQDQEGRP